MSKKVENLLKKSLYVDIEVFDDRLAYGGSISLDFARWTSNSDRISISFQATNTTYSEFLKMIGK